MIVSTPLFARVFALSSMGLVLILPVAPATGASLHGPLEGSTVDFGSSVPAAAPGSDAIGLSGRKTGARAYFEPERTKPAAETCTFSLDALCSDDTGWLNREVFGTEYRFDPSDDAQGAPSDAELGLGAISGASGWEAKGDPPFPDALSQGTLPIGAIAAD